MFYNHLIKCAFVSTEGRCDLDEKSKAQCIFDIYDLKFGMSREEVAKLLPLMEDSTAGEEALKRAYAQKIEFIFDHHDMLWMVKAYYYIDSHPEAEALLERMSQDFRFQTPSCRVAFDLEEHSGGPDTLNIRYTELNRKRNYIHHMMAVGAAMKEAEEDRARIIKEKEDEEYIPSGPLVF
jgi:hypothetical protein